MKEPKYRKITALRAAQLLEDAMREDIESSRRLRNLQYALIEHLRACVARKR